MNNALLIAHTCIMSTFLFLILLEVKKFNKSFSTHLSKAEVSPPTEDISLDANTLSSYELERLERERMFDERINTLKAELNKPRHGVTAEVLHPNVYNLPHDDVKTIYDLVEEVAE